MTPALPTTGLLSAGGSEQPPHCPRAAPLLLPCPALPLLHLAPGRALTDV